MSSKRKETKHTKPDSRKKKENVLHTTRGRKEQQKSVPRQSLRREEKVMREKLRTKSPIQEAASSSAAHVKEKSIVPTQQVLPDVEEVLPDVEEARQFSSSGIAKQRMVEVTEDVDEEERVRSFPQWNYSDEEFEEDFEEDLDSDHYEKAEEVPSSPIEQDVLQAIAAENQDLSHAQAALPSAPSPPSHFSPAHKVDFSFRQMASRSPVRISAIANKRVQSRARELLELVELDTLSFTLLELQPLSEYDVYMRNYGCSGTRQVGVQTREDSEEVASQTEPVASAHCWVQWPPEDLKGFGGEEDELEEMEVGSRCVGKSQELLRFLTASSQVLASLLDEASLSSGSQTSTSKLPFCTTCTVLSSTSVGVCQCRTSSSGLLAFGGVCSKLDSAWPGRLEVWRPSLPSSPLHELVCQSVPLCCCFFHTYLLVAGCEDGSLVLWDLREPKAMHNFTGPLHETLRVPTFSTAGAVGSVHCEPIHTITPLTRETGPAVTPSLSVQLAALDEAGMFSVWVVVEMNVGEPTGSESDLGLVPGGRVKLVLSSSSSVFRPSSPAQLPGAPCCMALLPSDPSELFVGTSAGSILHHVRYKSHAIPLVYQPLYSDGGGQVTSISFNHWEPGWFLAGTSSGSLSLFNTKQKEAMLGWPSSRKTGVQQLHWLPSSPSIFSVLYQDGFFSIWDLLISDTEPLHSWQFDHGVHGYLLLAGDTESSWLVIGYETGTTELHHFQPQLCNTGSTAGKFHVILKNLLCFA